jgi:hypothetical protein
MADMYIPGDSPLGHVEPHDRRLGQAGSSPGPGLRPMRCFTGCSAPFRVEVRSGACGAGPMTATLSPVRMMRSEFVIQREGPFGGRTDPVLQPNPGNASRLTVSARGVDTAGLRQHRPARRRARPCSRRPSGAVLTRACRSVLGQRAGGTAGCSSKKRMNSALASGPRGSV